jgi:hypothetical protein
MAVNIGSAFVVFERFKALCWHVMHLGEAAHSGWVSRHHYRSETVERRWKFDSGAAVTSVSEPARKSSVRSRPAGFACAAARVDATALASCRSLHLCLGKLTAAATPSLLDTVVVTQRRRRVTSFAF